MAARDSSFHSDRHFMGTNFTVSLDRTVEEYEAAVKSLVPHIVSYFIDDCTFFVGTPFGPDAVVTITASRIDKHGKKHGGSINIRPSGDADFEWSSQNELSKWRYMTYRTIMERASENGTKKPLTESANVIKGLIDKIKNPDKESENGTVHPDAKINASVHLVPDLSVQLFRDPTTVYSRVGTVMRALTRDGGSFPLNLPTQPMVIEQQPEYALVDVSGLTACIDGYESTDGQSPTDFVECKWPCAIAYCNQTPELEQRWIDMALDINPDTVDLAVLTTFLNDVVSDWPFTPAGVAPMMWIFAWWDQDGEDRELLGYANTSDKKMKFYWSSFDDCIYVKPVNTGR